MICVCARLAGMVMNESAGMISAIVKVLRLMISFDQMNSGAVRVTGKYGAFLKHAVRQPLLARLLEGRGVGERGGGQYFCCPPRLLAAPRLVCGSESREY